MKTTQHPHIIKLCLILTIILGVTPACRDSFNECLSGPGQTTTKRIGLYPFKNVKLRDNIGLTLVNGSVYEMEVTAGKNIIPMLGIEIINQTLNLRNNSTCPLLKDPWKTIEVRLTVPELDTIFVENHGDINSMLPFETDDLVIRISDSPSNINLEVKTDYVRVENLTGTGDIALKGFSEVADCYHAGYGTIDFRYLVCQEVNINSTSVNHCYIRAGEDYLFAVVSGEGNIYYHNDPIRLDLKLEGQGRLIKVP